MTDESDVLARASSDKKDALSLNKAWAFYLRAKQEAPEFLSKFEKIIGSQEIKVKSRTLDDVGFQNALREFAREFATVLTKENEQGKKREPGLAQSLPPEEILANAQRIIVDEATFSTRYRGKFVSRLVDNYVNQLRAQQRADAVASSGRIKNRLNETAQRSTEANFTKEALVVIREETNNQQMVNAARQSLEQPSTLDEVHAYYSRDKTFQSVREAIVDANIDNPDLYGLLLVNHVIDHPLSSIEDGKEAAAKQARLLMALAANSVVENKKTLDPSGVAHEAHNEAIKTFFQSFADTGAQKTLAPAMDALVAVFGPDTQFAVADIITGKAFKKHLEQAAAQVAATGSPYFGLSLSDIHSLQNKAGGHLRQLEAKHGGDVRVKASLFVSSFLYAKPNEVFDEMLKLQQEQGKYLQDVVNASSKSLSVGLPRGDIAHLGGLHVPHTNTVLFLEHTWMNTRDGIMGIIFRNNPLGAHVLFQNATSWAIRWGAGRAAGVAGRAAAGWALKTAFGKLVGGLVSALGGPVGVVAGLLLGDVAGGIFGKIKGFFGGLLNAGRYGHTGKRRWYEDPASWGFAALLVGAPLIIIFFLSFQTMSMLSGAFFVTSPRNVGGGVQVSPSLKYDGQVAPVSAINTAPASGSISQGPLTGVPGETHNRVDAVDIPAPVGTAVVAAQDCYLISNETENACLSDPNLGTYVRCVGSCGGQQCFTTYAHLSSCSSIVTTAIPGDTARQSEDTKQALRATTIKAGQKIGEVGSTGNSTGSHLHFQYNGPGKLEDFFPSIANGKI